MYDEWTVMPVAASMKSRTPTGREPTMNLRRLAKDASSGKHGCPSVYVDDDNPTDMWFQGRRGRGVWRQMIQRRRGEVAGRVPAETVIRAARAYLAEHGESL
jgi:hypothetical protein